MTPASALRLRRWSKIVDFSPSRVLPWSDNGALQIGSGLGPVSLASGTPVSGACLVIIFIDPSTSLQ